MEFFKQYLKIINYTLIGLVFAFTSFYLLANGYHYLELRKDYHVEFNSQPLVTSFENKIKTVNDNISKFNANTYQGSIPVNKMQVFYHNLKTCSDKFSNETIQNMKDKDKITIIDVYKLRESYENDILNGCIVNNLYWLTTINSDTFNSRYLLDNKDMIQLYINSLLDETSYLKKDLINNSSYFFNTSIASSSIKDNTRDGFYEVMGAYNKAASFVEYVSHWYKDEVEDNHD